MNTHIQLAGIIPGGTEALLIFAVIVLLFGGSKIPVLGKSLGEGINNFRKAFKQPEEEEAQVAEVAPPIESERVEKLEEKSTENSKGS